MTEVYPREIRDPIRYADCFRVPRSISRPFLTDVNRWESSCGAEWTVSRLKAIKLDFIRMKAGLDPVSVWIRREGFTFKGPLGGLQKWCSKSWKRWSLAIQFLQVYTIYVAPDVTSTQEKKFLDGVMAPNIDIPPAITLGVRTSVLKLNLFRGIRRNPAPLVCRPFSSTKREPHANGKSYTEGTATLECAVSFTRSTRNGWDFRSLYRNIFDYVEEGIDLEDKRDADLCDYPSHVGKIGIIQEPGFKLRAVANPARVYQQALSPLGDELYDLLKSLPWDCTHNQSLADEFITHQLQRQNNCYCVDLSGATDYFPLDLQISVLKMIFGDTNPYVDLFAKLSRQPWRYKDGFISWTKGQPLGLYPSFASFALTHGLLLYALNGYKHLCEFFVLGDDVIILDEELYKKYRAVLTELQCPVSEMKTIISSTIAEFAGSIYYPFGKIPQLKWRSVSDDSFIDILRNIGPRAMRLLKPRQRKVALKLSSIPDFMGGLGWNPKGENLESRIYRALVLFDKEKRVSFLMSYNRVLNAFNYYDATKFPTYRSVKIDKSDADQTSLAYVLRFLPSMVNWYEILGANLFTLQPDLDLPVESKVRRQSRLQQLEKQLDI